MQYENSKWILFHTNVAAWNLQDSLTEKSQLLALPKLFWPTTLLIAVYRLSINQVKSSQVKSSFVEIIVGLLCTHCLSFKCVQIDTFCRGHFEEKCVMNNYLGIGLDAKISLDFNQLRDEHPEKCCSRARNRMCYGMLGGREIIAKTYKNLEQRIRLECDGQLISLPNLQGIVILNIPRCSFRYLFNFPAVSVTFVQWKYFLMFFLVPLQCSKAVVGRQEGIRPLNSSVPTTSKSLRAKPETPLGKSARINRNRKYVMSSFGMFYRLNYSINVFMYIFYSVAKNVVLALLFF